MKINPLGAELFHADRRTNMVKLIVVFRNFANAPKNESEKVMFFIAPNRKTVNSTIL